MEGREKMHVLTGGMILITLGVLILLNGLDIYSFTRSWPILLIIIAIGTLIQRARDIGGWFIGIAGLIFLISQNGWVDLNKAAVYLLPLLLIVIGANILRKHYQKQKER